MIYYYFEVKSFVVHVDLGLPKGKIWDRFLQVNFTAAIRTSRGKCNKCWYGKLEMYADMRHSFFLVLDDT